MPCNDFSEWRSIVGCNAVPIEVNCTAAVAETVAVRIATAPASSNEDVFVDDGELVLLRETAVPINQN